MVGRPAPTGSTDLDAVSCADADHCWAVGVPGPNTTSAAAASAASVIASTADGGLTWDDQLLPLATTPELTGISCPGSRLCMAVGATGTALTTGIVLTTDNGGATWTQAAAPPNAIDISSVQCTSASDCTALATDGTLIWSASTVNFGQSWQQEGNLPSGLVDASGISCIATTTCVVAGYTQTSTGHGQGAVAISVDGGATWTAATVPSGLGVLHDATCASVTRCLAVGTTSTTVSDIVPGQGELLLSDDGGHTWAPAPVTPPVDDDYAVDCPLPQICTMAGTNWVRQSAIGTGAVAQSLNGGTTFKASTTSYTPLTLTALDCPSAAGCIAVGGDTVARVTLTQLPTIGRRGSYR